MHGQSDQRGDDGLDQVARPVQAVGLDGGTRKRDEDYWNASALVGMRYSF